VDLILEYFVMKFDFGFDFGFDCGFDFGVFCYDI
jgi:hypothetical protein